MLGGGSETSTDILQEILSVAQASHELANQSCVVEAETWDGGLANVYTCSNNNDDFTFMAPKDCFQDWSSVGRFDVESSWEDPYSKCIDVGDADGAIAVENLRWVGMSNQVLDEV